MNNDYHKPVLLKKSIDFLMNDRNGIYVDVTYGGGGHSQEILKRLRNGKLFAFDQDIDVQQKLPEDDRFIFIRHNYRYMKNFLKYYGVNHINGLIADLGVSSHHFDTTERGFTFRNEAPLDMRMNVDSEKKAEDVVNTYPVDDLNTIFRNYGEIKNPGRISKAIEKYRSNKRIKTTLQLVESISDFAPKFKEYKFLAKIFQAIRIEVNNEMENLKEMLRQSIDFLLPGDRLVVISYHSLEDRIVKNFFNKGDFEGEQEKDFYGNIKSPLKQVNRKIIVPQEKEIKDNSRARSARMRIAEKK